MAKKPESRLQLRIKKKLIATFGGKWVKLHGGPFQEAGLPDLFGVVGTFTFLFEIKVPGRGKPSALQLEVIREYQEAGAIACIVESVEEAVALVEETLARPEKRRCGGKLRKWIRRTIRATHRQDVGNMRHSVPRTLRQPQRPARRTAH